MRHTLFIALVGYATATWQVTGGKIIDSWKRESDAEVCKVSRDGLCVQDISGDYGLGEQCSFTYTGSATILRVEWGLQISSNEETQKPDYYGDDSIFMENCEDWLQIVDSNNKKSRRFCGSITSVEAFPPTMKVSGVTSFNFYSHLEVRLYE